MGGTQLRLVEAPRRATPRPARSRRRRGHGPDWRLDAELRSVGRRGVEEAKRALAKAALRKAS